MAKDTTFEIRAGHGASSWGEYDGKGVNFALFSAHAERVELCLFESVREKRNRPAGAAEYTHEVWHGLCPT